MRRQLLPGLEDNGGRQGRGQGGRGGGGEGRGPTMRSSSGLEWEPYTPGLAPSASTTSLCDLSYISSSLQSCLSFLFCKMG